MHLDKPIELRVEEIETHVDLDRMKLDRDTAIRMARNHYEEDKFIVLDGKKFEKNVLLFLHDDRRKYADDYIRMRIGKVKTNEDTKGYADIVMSVMPEHAADIFLYLCRVCSFVEENAFPDLVVLTENGKMWLKYVVTNGLTLGQQLFLVLAKMLSVDIQIVRIVRERKDEKILLEPKVVLESVLDDNRAATILTAIEQSIEYERKKLGTAGVDDLDKIEDEISYLIEERQKYPFFLLKRWLEEGEMDREELLTNMSLVLNTNLEEKHAFEKYAILLKKDGDWHAIEDSGKKADYLQSRFVMGESRAKSLMRFLEY